MKNRKSFSSFLLVILISFQIISAVPAGLMLIIDPTGTILGLPIEILQHSPFLDFLIPGLFLCVVLGLIPVLIVYGLVKRNKFKFAQHLNLYKKYHWSLTFSYYFGLILILWIVMQILFIKEFDLLHFIYSMLGIMIIITTHLPSTKKDYKM